jgi:small-conductance mechanosensitive channel
LASNSGTKPRLSSTAEGSGAPKGANRVRPRLRSAAAHLAIGALAFRRSTAALVFKAILNFPVDLAFLAISFSAIILPYMQARLQNPISTKDVMFWFVLYVVAALVVTVLSRHSDKAFVADKNKNAFFLVIPAYFVSIFVIVLSLSAI